LAELLAAVEQSAIADALRLRRWAYPLVSASHIFGIALLFGAILPLDLRLLGVWRSVPLNLLARVLVPVAGVGLGVTLLTGPLLLSVDPFRYAGLWIFWLKLLLIAVATVNLLLLHCSTVWREACVSTTIVCTFARQLRLAGLVSALAWSMVILCGRLIAYF
jgi:hypothetical protein